MTLHALHACCAPVHSYRFVICACAFNIKNVHLEDQTDQEPSDCMVHKAMRWQILLLSFGKIIWGKCCMSGFAHSILSLMDTASPSSHSQENTYLLLKCSSVALGVLMLHCWETTLYSRMSLLFKENKTNRSHQPCAFKFIYKYGVKIFSHVALLSQHNSTLCVTCKQAEISFLQDCCLLLTSAEELMWFQPESPPFHLHSLWVTSYLKLLVY